MSTEQGELARARVGTTIKGKWTIDRLVGMGGMAVVYAATHRNKKRAALKMLHAELSAHPEIRARFLREGYIANTVGHPGAVAVHDDDVADDGAVFLVMELLEGESLQERWERAGRRLPLGDVLRWIDGLLDVIAAAHERGIVHRDLKPDNLFLLTSGEIKVLDFGIARIRELAPKTATHSGILMGTPTFMAPEQARGRWDEVDARTDLWAVGATAFTLLSGRYVHEAETANETLVKAVMDPAPSLRERSPDLPEEVVALVDRALSYDMDARFADARAMQSALRVVVARLPQERLAALGAISSAGAPGESGSGGGGTLRANDDAARSDAAHAATVSSSQHSLEPAHGTEQGITTSPAASPPGRRLTVVTAGVAASIAVGVLLWIAPWRDPQRPSSDEHVVATATNDPRTPDRPAASEPPAAGDAPASASVPSVPPFPSVRPTVEDAGAPATSVRPPAAAPRARPSGSRSADPFEKRL